MKNNLFLLNFGVIVLILLLSGCNRLAASTPGSSSSEILSTQTPYPSFTPFLTQTLYPTFTVFPTYTSFPTNVAYATYTPFFTHTPFPTYTVYPTATYYPTFTLPPPTHTFTPLPPTDTATPVPPTLTSTATQTNTPTLTATVTSTRTPQPFTPTADQFANCLLNFPGKYTQFESGWKGKWCDTFDSNSLKWWEDSADDDWTKGSATIKNGKYIWESHSKNSGMLWRSNPFNSYDANFQITAEIFIKSDHPDNNAAGFVFRDTKTDYYRFIIYNSGRYDFSLFTQKDGWKTVVSGNNMDAIQADRPNWLSIIAKDSNFKFYVNGQLINDCFDSSLSTGSVGLAIEQAANENGIFEYDNFLLVDIE